MQAGKIDIKSLLPEELAAALAEMGEKGFRAKQVFAWLGRGVESFDEMTDLSKALRAKLGLHLLITELPLMLCAVCVAAVSGLDFLHAALVVVVPMVYVVLSAAFGLFMGLKRPNLTWTSEVAPIKQGLAVFLSMFGGWVLAAGLGFLYYALMAHLGAAAFLLAATALFIVLALVLLRWLKTSGAKIYAHL